MSYYETPFCVCYFYADDPEINQVRTKLVDDAIEYFLHLIDAFAYEYKWTKDAILSLRCTERFYLFRLIQKRNEHGDGMDGLKP